MIRKVYLPPTIVVVITSKEAIETTTINTSSNVSEDFILSSDN